MGGIGSGRVALVYPHQLFPDHPALQSSRHVVLVEDPLFFSQYRFHRQKLILHRASMSAWAESRRREGFQVDRIEAHELAHSSEVGSRLRERGITTVDVVDVCDDWLEQRLQASGLEIHVHPDPHFLTPLGAQSAQFAGKRRLFFTEFYVAQRKRLGLLLDSDGKPVGGKWSFDPENRKRLPAKVLPPRVTVSPENEWVREARYYVRTRFPDALGEDTPFEVPVDREAAVEWLREFVTTRLGRFGDYEDAISREHSVLFHSVLTPMLNIGLLSPSEVVHAALQQAEAVPINSLEGFIRQVIGWREYVRLVYRDRGRQQRTRNHFGFTKPLPASFYDGTTGIEPVDHVIHQVLRTGYCHHIERLMILGNFMLLCEFDPDAVYQWFMEMFVDAYDWVMVPNVYGMSQFADGGQMTTKPYISGSSYVLKMSDFGRGPWCEVWDALFWRFVDRHEDVFRRNPRTSMIVNAKARLGDRLREHHRVADEFLSRS